RRPPPPPLFPYTTLFRSAVLMPAGRMHHEPRRLVDDDQVLVLVDHRQRDILADRIGRLCRRHDERERIALDDLALAVGDDLAIRSEEHTSELQSRFDLVC